MPHPFLHETTDRSSRNLQDLKERASLGTGREIGILLPNNQRQHRTLHIHVSAALASIFRMDSISTSYAARTGDAHGVVFVHFIDIAVHSHHARAASSARHKPPCAPRKQRMPTGVPRS